MDYVACTLRNFKLKDYSEPLEIKPEENTWFFILYQEPEVMAIRNSYEYINRFGNEEVSRILSNYVAITAYKDSITDVNKRYIIINNFYANAQAFSNALWFIKDNPVTPYFTTISSDQAIEPRGLRRNVYYTDSKGTSEVVEFSSEEILNSYVWIKHIDKLRTTGKSIDFKGYNQPLYNMSSHISFDVPSFQRAYYFLNETRRSDFLPAKIASYISVLESLLAVKGDNVHKTGERVAKLIGLNETEKWELYKQIELAYGLRSDYVHGSYIAKEINRTLPEVSKNLDDVVRRVFKEMLLNHQNLNYDTATKKHVNSAFIRMVLS